jgi:protein-S-isoprenylcysteine O-methyltransferase Ste14
MMGALELKVPPPAVALVVALVMWGVARVGTPLDIELGVRVAGALAIALIGAAFSVAGIAAFRRAKTTVNPMKPQAASSLVTDGVYRITRNPMYVGLTCVLLAWAVFMGVPWALMGPVGFVAYTTRFQIVPEERALSSLFAEQYRAYTASVRRWL